MENNTTKMETEATFKEILFEFVSWCSNERFFASFATLT